MTQIVAGLAFVISIVVLIFTLMDVIDYPYAQINNRGQCVSWEVKGDHMACPPNWKSIEHFEEHLK